MSKQLLTLTVLVTTAIMLVLLSGCAGTQQALPTSLQSPVPTAEQPSGVSLIVQVLPLDGNSPLTADVMSTTQSILLARVAKSPGVTSATVGVAGADRLQIHLQGSGDLSAAIEAVTHRGYVEFIDGGGNPPSEGAIVETSEGAPAPVESIPTTSTVWRAIIRSEDLEPGKAAVTFDPASRPQLQLTLTTDGAKKLADYTSAHIGSYMPIVVDKKVISRPLIQSAITGGTGVINNISLSEAQALASQLNAGVLPARLQLLDTQRPLTATVPSSRPTTSAVPPGSRPTP